MSPDELAAIRERDANGPNDWLPTGPAEDTYRQARADRRALLAHIDALEAAVERIALGLEGRRTSGFLSGEKTEFGFPCTDWELAEALLRGRP